MRRGILLFVLAALLVQPCLAFVPSRWIYASYPYMYSHRDREWYYFDQAVDAAVLNTTTRTWYLLGNSFLGASWSYWEWPYAYSLRNDKWYYIDENTQQYVLDLGNNQWTRLGDGGESVVVGDWDFFVGEGSSYTEGDITFSADGSVQSRIYYDPPGQWYNFTGNWSLTDSDIYFTLSTAGSSAQAIYRGTVETASRMDGTVTFAGGSTGSWYTTR
ncbi:hypothetical protein ACFLSJ_07240 [Verrucomicrobiota bacterium]